MSLAIPVYNQLADLLPDGRPDPFATTDCGAECVAMVADAFGYGGIPGLSAGQIRVIIRRGNLSGVGLTTADDLVYGLANVARLPSHTRSAPFGAMQIELQHAIAAREPAIVLGDWDGAAAHWMVCRDADASGATFNDPWGGLVSRRPWSAIAPLYLGSYVHIDRSLP